MTRNDFEILARHLKAMRPVPESDGVIGYSDDYCAGYTAAINQVMGACSSVNSRFNAKMFKEAAGYQA